MPTLKPPVKPSSPPSYPLTPAQVDAFANVLKANLAFTRGSAAFNDSALWADLQNAVTAKNPENAGLISALLWSRANP